MDYLFVNGHLKAKSTELLKLDDYRKLGALFNDDFLRLLFDLGYTDNAKLTSFDELIYCEFLNIKKEIISLFGEKSALERCFFFNFDMNNIKIVLKEYLFGIPERGSIYSNLGTISHAAIERAIKRNDFELLTEEEKVFFRKLLDGNKNKNSKEISDKVVILGYEFLLENYIQKNSYLDKFYQHLTTQINILTLLRVKRLGLSLDEFTSSIIPFGFIPKDTFITIFGLSEGDIITSVEPLLFGNIKELLLEYISDRDLEKLEAELDKTLLDAIQDFDYEVETIAPAIKYLYMKKMEMKNVKRLFYSHDTKYLVLWGDDNE